MIIDGINPDLCIKCKKCIEACPSALFLVKEQNDAIFIHFADSFKNCIQCGHCIAICPTHAIKYLDSESTQEFPADWQQQKPVFQQLETFLRGKRSIRSYSNQALSFSLIEEILNVMRYAPSASNARQWKFHIITDSEKISELSREVVKSIKLTRSLVKNWIIRKLFLFGEIRKQVNEPGFIASLNRIIEESEKGKDPIFFNAPCIIILHSPKYGNLAGVDSGIIITYGMLAAEAKGLGSCWIGIAQEAMQRLPKLRKKFGLQRSQFPWGVFIIGNPKIKYQRLPPRSKLEVSWEDNMKNDDNSTK